MPKKPPLALVEKSGEHVDKPRTKPREPLVGELVPQAHGGALRHGGTNKGGPGRPPSLIRSLFRDSFANRLWVLEDVADGEPMVRVRDALGNETGATRSASPGDRIKAVDVLGKYGLGTQVEEIGTQTIEIILRNESQSRTA